MKVDGACHCGNIAFEAVIDEARAGLCHCTDCQALSGAPFRASAPAKAEDFRLLCGTPKTYVKTADSGNKRLQAFCGDCGSPIYATSPDNQAVLNLRLGILGQRAAIVPKRQIWCDSALGWAKDIAAIPSVPKG